MERHQTILKKTEKVWKNLGVHYAEIFEYTEDKKTKNQQLENIETVVLNSTQNSKCLGFRPRYEF